MLMATKYKKELEELVEKGFVIFKNYEYQNVDQANREFQDVLQNYDFEYKVFENDNGWYSFELEK